MSVFGAYGFQLLWFAVLLMLTVGLYQNRRLNSKLRASRTVIDRHVLLLEVDLKGRVVSLSQALAEHSGHRPDVLQNCPAAVLWPRELLDTYHEQLQRVIRTGEVWRGEVEQIKAYGERYLADLTITPRFDHHDNLIGITEIRRDITASKRIEQLSVTDEMTGLANRRHFNQIIKQELERARRSRTPLCLAVLDVDCFKGYNDTYGHQAGDMALQQVADVLKTRLRRASDFSFRMGGEEFALLFSATDKEEALTILEGVREAIQQLAIMHSANTAAKVLTVSMGYCIPKQPSAIEPAVLYQEADKRLYEAKSKGRNRVCGIADFAEQPLLNTKKKPAQSEQASAG